MSNVRRATQDDIEPLVRIYGEKFYQLSPFAAVAPFHAASTERMLTALFRDENAALWVVDTDPPCGAIVGILIPLWMTQSGMFVQEVFWYVDEAVRNAGIAYQLFDALVQWATENGALALVMHDIAGGPDLSKFYGRLGFVKNETMYVRPL